jgi:Fur family ferric uptake transcriptional regulator
VGDTLRPTINSLCAKLQQKSYKITPQRQIILKAFLDHYGRHLSADELHALLQEQHPEIGLATVYRTLEILANLDILRTIEFGDGCTRYEVVEEEEVHHHHHLICINCGKVIECNDDLLETLETWIAKQTKFQIIDHQLKFYGYCYECQQQKE